MTVLFVVLTFSFFLTVDYLRKTKSQGVIRWHIASHPELGPCACDGGEKIGEKKA